MASLFRVSPFSGFVAAVAASLLATQRTDAKHTGEE